MGGENLGAEGGLSRQTARYREEGPSLCSAQPMIGDESRDCGGGGSSGDADDVAGPDARVASYAPVVKLPPCITDRSALGPPVLGQMGKERERE